MSNPKSASETSACRGLGAVVPKRASVNACGVQQRKREHVPVSLGQAIAEAERASGGIGNEHHLEGAT